MLSSDDLLQMKADMADLISDHAVSIQLRRRQDAVPGSHTVRIERKGVFSLRTSPETERTVTRYVLASEEAFDIQNGDRFNAFGFLFEVANVSPRQVGIQADVYMVQ